MTLWILKPIFDPPPDGPECWDPWYDCVFGMIIRAKTEEQARQIAKTNEGSEGSSSYHPRPPTSPWLDPEYTTCEELSIEGTADIIIADTHWA